MKSDARRARLRMLAGAGALLAAAAAAGVPAGEASGGDRGRLPPGTLRGLAHLLEQYPAVSLATSKERTAAERLLEEIRTAVRPWRDPRRAAAAGYDTVRPRRRPGNRTVMWFHAEHRRHEKGGGVDPARPDVLIYADALGRPLVLVGVMFAMPRGVRGPTLGGPITRWHWHRVCARGAKRGLKPRPDGSCPPGTRIRNGSEMMHVWFTGDLRSAFAIHAPVPELCRASLLPASECHPDLVCKLPARR